MIIIKTNSYIIQYSLIIIINKSLIEGPLCDFVF